MNASPSVNSKNQMVPFAHQNTEYRVQELSRAVQGFMTTWPLVFPTVTSAIHALGASEHHLTAGEVGAVTVRVIRQRILGTSA
jgi:hypothetical protein